MRCHPQNGEHGSKDATDARLQTMARGWVGQVCMWMIMWEATESKNSTEVMNDLCADFSRYSYSTETYLILFVVCKICGPET